MASNADSLTGETDKWLNAFSDPLAGLYTFSSCMALADLYGDGDYKLILADLGTGKYSMTLKVYKGVTLFKENALVDLPTAVVTFFMDHAEPRVPAIAVASGPCVYIYKNLKPYYKFQLPSMDISETEKEVWTHVKNEQLDIKSLAEVLESLKNQMTFSAMTSRSQRFLVLKEEEEQENFVNLYKNDPLKKQSIITCLTTMKKSSQERDAIDSLVVGSENGSISVLDSEAFTVLTTATVPSAPSALHASGLYDVDYRILVCCRNGCVYTVKRGMAHVPKPTIQLNSHAVAMTRVGKTIMIGCMDQTLRCYSLKGRKMWSLNMPSNIMAMETLEYEPKNYLACIVSLENKEVHIYQEMFLVDRIKLDNVATGIRFGKFGREEGAIIFTTRNGGINVKLFKRTAKLEEKSAAPGPPAAQSQKLNVPKKTKVFVDQTMREREDAVRMHQVYQRDLFMLRLTTAKAYTKMLENKNNPISLNPDEMLKLSAQVQGFGPNFLIKIYLQTTSVQAAIGLSITFQYNPRLYSVEKNVIPVCLMVPGIQYSFQSKITCLMPDKGLSDDIKVLVTRDNQVSPLLMAAITMPVSEISLVD